LILRHFSIKIARGEIMAHRLLIWEPPSEWPTGVGRPRGVAPVQLPKDVLNTIRNVLEGRAAGDINRFIMSAEWILTQIYWRRGGQSLPSSEINESKEIKKELKRIKRTLTRLISQIENVSHKTSHYLGYTSQKRLEVLTLLKGYQDQVDLGLRLPNKSDGWSKKRKTKQAIAALAGVYKELFGARPSPWTDTNFSCIIISLLPHLGESTEDPRRLILAALKS
jgi:hypothetical protein